MARIRVMVAASIMPMALGIEGNPYVASVGTELDLPEEAFEKLRALHAPNVFLRIDEPEGSKRKARGKDD